MFLCASVANACWLGLTNSGSDTLPTNKSTSQASSTYACLLRKKPRRLNNKDVLLFTGGTDGGGGYCCLRYCCLESHDLPRIARQGTVCLVSIRGQVRKARIEKFELDEVFQPYHPPSDLITRIIKGTSSKRQWSKHCFARRSPSRVLRIDNNK